MVEGVCASVHMCASTQYARDCTVSVQAVAKCVCASVHMCTSTQHARDCAVNVSEGCGGGVCVCI